MHTVVTRRPAQLQHVTRARRISARALLLCEVASAGNQRTAHHRVRQERICRAIGQARASADFGNIACTCGRPARGSLRSHGLCRGRTGDVLTVAELRLVADLLRVPAGNRVRFKQVVRAIGVDAVTRFGCVTGPGAGAAHGLIGGSCVVWAINTCAVAALWRVALSRARAANRRLEHQNVVGAGQAGAIAHFVRVARAPRGAAGRALRECAVAGRIAARIDGRVADLAWIEDAVSARRWEGAGIRHRWRNDHRWRDVRHLNDGWAG